MAPSVNAVLIFETLQNYAATAVQSDFFAGGLTLGAMGLLAGSAHGWGRLSELVARKLSVTVVVDNRLAEFRHVLNWQEKADAFARVRRALRRPLGLAAE